MVKLTQFIGSIAIAAMTVVVLFMGITDLGNEYNRDVSQEMNDSIQSIDDTYSTLQADTVQARNETIQVQGEQSQDSGVNVGQALLATKNLLTNGFSLSVNILTAFEKRLGIHSIFKGTAMLFIVLAIITITLSVIFNRDV